MNRAARSLAAAAALVLLASPLRADTIELTNGRVIEADRAWYEGTQVRYERDGGIYGIPRALVKRVQARSGVTLDPDLARGRDRLTAGDPVAATRLLRQVVARDPRSLPALQALADAYIALGDPRSARDAARRAVALDPRAARSHELLGDALAALGDRLAAEEAYRASLSLRPDPQVERKLADVGPAPPGAGGGARFRLRHDGSVNEPLAVSVLGTLDGAYADYARLLGFRPGDPIEVVLEAEAVFQNGRTPEWAAGINDGTIRVPLSGMDRPSPELLAVLRHELAHSFIAARTRGNCPTWLQEGISQWLEGGDPARADAHLSALARQRTLPSLLSLEAPFHTMTGPEAVQAYAASLSGVAHLIRLRKEAGVLRLLAALSDGLPSEEALPVATALSYPEFQQSWREYLFRAPRMNRERAN
jgi:Tetratricopeptide repeat/Peptidase MA superfamily